MSRAWFLSPNRRHALADGVEELEPVITSKNTYIAPFVNAEETEYLVIEDDFPNGNVLRIDGQDGVSDTITAVGLQEETVRNHK